MKVLATTAYPMSSTTLDCFLHYYRLDKYKVHSLVTDPESADLILFVDPPNPENDFFLKNLFTHPLIQEYWYKILVYNERDEPFTRLPGLYTSLHKSKWNPNRHRPCPYLQGPNSFVEELFNASRSPEERDILVSFMGSSQTHIVRQTIFNLNFKVVYLEDTSHYWFFGEKGNLRAHDSDEQIKQKKLKYCEVMNRSKFALCPRGKSPSSFRIYEALVSGCVPIIISDEWVPPEGPDWKEFCVFVPEKSIGEIESIIRNLDAKYTKMSQMGQIAYQHWFASDVLFHRMIESCSRILNHPRWPEFFWQRIPCQVYLKRKVFFILKSLR